MPHIATRTSEFRPFKWIGAAAMACAVAFVLGLGYGQHDANQAGSKTTAAPAWRSGALSEPFDQFVRDGSAPGSVLYTEYRAELAGMQGYGVQGPVDQGAVLLALALRCY
ncbi:hypothetical protein [Kutzneria chonburiensis]|uniref:Uncharacterized protein n=1 Tax=Kutzneria chonburiensis TaxID=1483604 RepID=A0ABV6MZH0_9PSEU|nr:hypothetical protein [Kutzneria chonburiensis]